MKVFWIAIYNLLLYPLFFIGACVSALVNKKIREGLKGRRLTYSSLIAFKNKLSKKTDIYWFHASSHGEYEQLKPVIEGLKDVEPSSKIIVSFFSPSGFNNIDDPEIDCKVYLPLDFPWSVARVLLLLKPKKVIIAEYDVWPNLIWMAKLRGIPTTVFSVHFSDGTPKLLPLIKNFYRSVYGDISNIYAEAHSDYDMVNQLLGKKSKSIVRVLGNPRYDQVKKKTDQFTEKRTLSVFLRNKQIIAGSVWKEDEYIILNPLTKYLNENINVSLVWVPHETNPKQIDRAFEYFSEAGLSTSIHREKRLPVFGKTRVVIVGVVGLLSSLYWSGQIAYIGGGFSTGVHNVMEPAIARLPVIFGPKYKNSHAAKELVLSNGGYSISNSEEFSDTLNKIFSDKNYFLNTSLSATDVIHKNLGSATRVVRGILRD